MSDAALRAAERDLAADPLAWRPALALLLRASRHDDARRLLEATEARLREAGEAIGRAYRMARICGASHREELDRLAAVTANVDELIRLARARGELALAAA